MRTHSPLVIDVRELLEHPGVRKPLVFEAPVPDLKTGLATVSGPVSFELVLEAIDGGLLVQGRLGGTYTAQCRRCLKPLEADFRVEGAEIYRPKSDPWDEQYLIDEMHIDLDPMVRDMVILDLDSSPVCTPGCRGLCSSCGMDLNEGDCGCEEEIDPRWSALKSLRGLKDLAGGDASRN